MRQGFLSEYFEDVVAKRLSAVEANPENSNQHEFNGVRGLRRLLGNARLTDCPTRFIWIGKENEGFSENSFVTWYDSRENHPTRTEYRLYFRNNSVMDFANEGDLLVVAKRSNGDLIIIVVNGGSTVENQLLWLFGISEQVEITFDYRKIKDEGDNRVDYATRYILDELGIEIEEPEGDRLDDLLKRFHGVFPKTAVFSSFARHTLPDVIPQDDPDTALLAWMEWEEKLFRRLERHIVSDQLNVGFTGERGADVDGFIKFSLSVQNRRKSRTGYALENHLEQIFISCSVNYDRGAKTENNAKPDFLFPGIDEYNNTNFPTTNLSMLGVKSTCKDRWRQVLSEAAKIRNKHLLTLEPSISENQTNEMKSNRLQLVLPKELHQTYGKNQRGELMNLSEFIGFVRDKQNAT
ncbi:hypothetical protein JYT44_02260 [Caldithrix abyssi]|nr:hypothetical protein [Caldithrix abyssi]